MFDIQLSYCHPHSHRLKETGRRIKVARDRSSASVALDRELLAEMETSSLSSCGAGAAAADSFWDYRLSPNVVSYLTSRRDEDGYHYGRRRDLIRLFRNLWIHVIDGAIPPPVKADLDQSNGRSADKFLR